MLADLLRMSDSPRAALEPLQAQPYAYPYPYAYTPMPTPTPTLTPNFNPSPNPSPNPNLCLTVAGGVQARAEPRAGEA